MLQMAIIWLLAARVATLLSTALLIEASLIVVLASVRYASVDDGNSVNRL